MPYTLHESMRELDVEKAALCQPPNKRMQRARVMDKFVLCLGHRRVVDARRHVTKLVDCARLTVDGKERRI